MRGHDLELTFIKHDRKVFTIDIFEKGQWRKIDESDGDYSVQTIETLGGKIRISLIQADDAYSEIQASVDEVISSCRIDM
jgi:hypothetical protein